MLGAGLDTRLQTLMRAAFIMQTTELHDVKFFEVSASFARDEGEGDGSLEYWRR